MCCLLFGISKGSVYNVFWEVALVHASVANPLTRRWILPDFTDDLIDEMIEEFQHKSPYYIYLQDHIRDPLWPDMQRSCFIINLDAVHIEVENSKDMSYQRSVFSHKGKILSKNVVVANARPHHMIYREIESVF